MNDIKRVVLCAVMFGGVFGPALATVGPWDADVSDFPRAAGETGDSPRIYRAMDAAGEGGVVWFPRGEYEIDAMLDITNRCSLWLHKSAHLKAVREMPFVLRYFGGQFADGAHKGSIVDHNLFIKGGDIDGNGLASCANVMGLRHFTLADSTYRNGKKVGLQLGDDKLPNTIEGAYEITVNNLYFVCNLPGMAGNIGLLTFIGDSNFTDMEVIDYTIGISDRKWSNRYTRCHVWGGPVCKVGTTESEYLPDSISFDIRGADTVLDDCYADTAMTGFRISSDSRLVNCASYNNYKVFKMDNPIVIDHQGGVLLVTGGRFSKTSPNSVLYQRGEKAGRLIWRDNQPILFKDHELQALNDELSKQGSTEHSGSNAAKLAY